MKLLVVFLVTTFAFAQTSIPFRSKSIYKMEGTVEGKFFVINLDTSNEQRIKLSSLSYMVDGAQYAVCVKIKNDCHLECEGDVVGKPQFITPDKDPKVLIPDIQGAYAPVNKDQCL